MVLGAALALADRKGLEGVTIRALATELRIPPMSLYTHFANKERLYDLMFEEVVHRLFVTAEKGTWQEELEAGCRHAREILVQHPNWFPLLTRIAIPPLTLKLYDRLLELMSKDGYAPEAVMLAVSSAMSFTLGLLLVERMMTAHRAEPIPVQQLRLVKELVPRMSEGMYPWLQKATPSFDRFSFEMIFDVGLRSLLAGIELQAPSPEPGRRTTLPRSA